MIFLIRTITSCFSVISKTTIFYTFVSNSSASMRRSENFYCKTCSWSFIRSQLWNSSNFVGEALENALKIFIVKKSMFARKIYIKYCIFGLTVEKKLMLIRFPAWGIIIEAFNQFWFFQELISLKGFFTTALHLAFNFEWTDIDFDSLHLFRTTCHLF